MEEGKEREKKGGKEGRKKNFYYRTEQKNHEITSKLPKLEWPKVANQWRQNISFSSSEPA